MADNGWMPADTAMLTAPLSHDYPRQVAKLTDTADPAASIRNALTTQQDQHCAVVLAGPPTNLLAALALSGVKDLVASKVKFLVIAGEANASENLLTEWPTRIVIAGDEVGRALPFPGASIEKDFAWAKEHPIVDAYRAFEAMPYDAPASALAAALYAVRTKENYFKLSDGKPAKLVVDPEQKDRILTAYTELISAQPVDRFPRRRT
jgi:hypothetical protein